MNTRTSWMLSLTIATLMLAMLSSSALAATKTWTGTTSGSMSTASNWQGNVAPASGDDLVFPNGVVNTAINNDFPADTAFNSITLGNAYDLGGQEFLLGAGGLQLTVAQNVQISAPIKLSAAQTWAVASGGRVLVQIGGMKLNGQTWTVDTQGASAQVTMNSVLSGSGALIKNGVGQLLLEMANTYTGPTTINAGLVIVSNPNGLGAADDTAANGTTVNATGSTAGTLLIDAVGVGNEMVTLNGGGQDGRGALEGFGGPSTLAGPVVLATDAVINPQASLKFFGNMSGPGALTLIGSQPLTLVGITNSIAGLTGSGTLTMSGSLLKLNGSGTTTFSGAIGGGGGIECDGTGHLTLTGVNTMLGTATINHGTLTISGPSAVWTSNVVVNNDGHFSLTGNARAAQGISLNNAGHLEIDEGGAAIGNSGLLGLPNGTTFDVGGSLPSSLGKINVTGSVGLAGATLALHLPAGFAPALNTTYTIIDNDGTDAIPTTFAGLPEGATVTSGNVQFKVSYVGGTGNDVTLTVTSVFRDYLLSEGADSDFFTTDILLANPNTTAAPIHITFLKDNGDTIPMDDTLSPMSHKFLRVNNVPGMDATAFSTIVRSVAGFSLVVERTMSWDKTGYGAHTEHATDGAATTWYFAEGSQGFFHTYLLLANPQATANTATVQYLREGDVPLTRTYALAATSRLTVDVGADAELVNRSFGMIVNFAQPGAAERAMYFGDVPLFNGGHESAGVNAPSTTWFLAEGATGPFFETFVLLANPGDTDATATLTYLPAGGSPIVATKAVPAHARVTVNLEGESPALSNAAVSTQVASTQPILVERSQYWPDPAPNWYEAHNSFGVTALDTKWGLSEGRVGNVDGDTNAQTYILLANPGTTPANVTITFLRDDPSTNVTHTFRVDPTTRFNVPVGPGTSVPELTNEHFGALVTSDQPIAVERALYWDANGQVWAAGTNATATPLP